jgi:hypothetical protein
VAPCVTVYMYTQMHAHIHTCAMAYSYLGTFHHTHFSVLQFRGSQELPHTYIFVAKKIMAYIVIDYIVMAS